MSNRVNLIDRRLSELVAPEYADLVAENLRRRLLGRARPPIASRWRWSGLQGQVSLLELTTAQIDFEGSPALLVTGVEVIPTQKLRALASGKLDEKETAARAALVAPPLPAPPPPAPPLQVFALQSLGRGHRHHRSRRPARVLNPAAEKLLAVGDAQALGRPLEDIVGLVDQNDRKLLADPIREAVGGGNGNPHTFERRAVLLGKASGEERAIELAASPLRVDDELVGAVVLLHDVTELRGLHRQMSYQATHDALTGLVNRREFERRLDEVDRSGAPRRGDAHVVLPRSRPLQDRQRHERPSRRRQHAARSREAAARSGARFRHGRAPRRRRVRHAARRLSARRRRARSPTTCAARSRRTASCGTTACSTSAYRIGLIEIGREAGTVEQLLAAADSACYVAKKEGAGRVSVYSARDEALARSTGEIEWLQKLQSALKEERFALYYQPIVAAYGDDTDGPVDGSAAAHAR